MTRPRTIFVRSASAARDPDGPYADGFDVLMTLDMGISRHRVLMSPKIAVWLGLQLLVSATIAWVKSR